MRINKYLAHKGLSTRKGADILIEEGSVYVNGKRALLGQKIQEVDKVEIRTNQTPINFRYIIYYKPRGVITHSPAEGETDIASRILKNHGLTGVFPIGRLDKDSEGLILLSDDGRITERILNPNMNHEKEYEVTVDRKVRKGFLSRLEKGVTIEGYITKPAKTRPSEKNDRLFCITLTEGKKHQVRRMCAALGYQVERLKRIRVMNFTLRNLKPGQMHKLSPQEAREFRRSLHLPN